MWTQLHQDTSGLPRTFRRSLFFALSGHFSSSHLVLNKKTPNLSKPVKWYCSAGGFQGKHITQSSQQSLGQPIYHQRFKIPHWPALSTLSTHQPTPAPQLAGFESFGRKTGWPPVIRTHEPDVASGYKKYLSAHPLLSRMWSPLGITACNLLGWKYYTVKTFIWRTTGKSDKSRHLSSISSYQ